MTLNNQSVTVKVLTVAYFIAAMVEIMSELFDSTPLIIIFKPLLPLLLMVLYWFTSMIKNPFFFIAMSFLVVTNLLFIPDDDRMLFFGIIIFMIHRIAVLFIIFQLIKLKDYIPMSIATVPFLLVFFYLLATSTEIPEDSYTILAIQNVLISILGGVALSNYIMNDKRQNTWLLISGLLFVSLQFIVFLEKYYLTDLSPAIFRPIAMALNVFAFYSFYEFVLTSENSDDNASAF